MNIANDAPNAWPHRKELVKSLVRYHDLDVFATQEGLPEQVGTMKSRLADAFEISAKPAYGPVGTYNGFKIDSLLDEHSAFHPAVQK